MTGRTTLVELTNSAVPHAFSTGVSLHAHSSRSNEIMTNVPGYLARIPVVRSLVHREMLAYTRRNGHTADFTRGWWRPPVSPEAVIDSEERQIARRLGLLPLVSLTDHDSVDACLELRAMPRHASVPISFEWTVPYRDSFFHLGVHNLRPDSAAVVFDALVDFTQGRSEVGLAELLGLLNDDPGVLLVLNHPLWDLPEVGAARHAVLLRAFLDEHGGRLHAVEVNGYRSWPENLGAMALAGARALPIVSGGDRHGCAPNCLLNLSDAASLGEFAREIREGRHSTVLVMPEYRQSLVARKLEVVADAIRDYETYPPGHQRWTDRITYERHGVVRRLSDHWPTGGPLWVRSTVSLFRIGTSAPFLPLLVVLVWLAGAAASSDFTGRSGFMDDDGAPQASSSYGELVE